MKFLVFILNYFLFITVYAQNVSNYHQWLKQEDSNYDRWSSEQAWKLQYFHWLADQKNDFEAFKSNAKASFYDKNHSSHTLKSLKGLTIWAVIVGISYYRDESIRLHYSDDDAYKFYGFLKSPEGGALAESHIKLLIDEEASAKNIKNTLEEIIPKVGENDVFIFYFSGHGSHSSLLAEDFNTSATGTVKHKYINDLLSRSNATTNLCIIDACHAGAIAIKMDSLPRPKENFYVFEHKSEPKKGEYTNNRSIQSLEKQTLFYDSFFNPPPQIVYFLSTKKNEEALELGDMRQGFFSYYLIKGLHGDADYNHDHIISITECFDYIKKNVVAKTYHLQTPVMIGDYNHSIPIGLVRK